MLLPLFLLLAAPAEPVNLLADLSRWSGNVDRAPSTIAVAAAGRALTVKIDAVAGPECYPKARIGFDTPQDWQGCQRLHARLRVTSTDPDVQSKTIAFVFYDAQTLREDLPDHPMTQQALSREVPVNEWVDLREWLTSIHRGAVRQLDLYLYSLPPDKAHRVTWEFDQLALEPITGQVKPFDGELYALPAKVAAAGAPAGALRTADGLALSVEESGRISGLQDGPQDVGTQQAPFSGLLVRDAQQDAPPQQVGGLRREGQVLRQSAKLGDLGLQLDATWRVAGDSVEIAGQVADTTGRDRAVTVYWAIPVADAPWQWWDSVAAARTTPDERGELSWLETGVQFGQGGAHSKYPLGALSLPGRSGLTLALRMDEPVVHRVTYNPALRLFYIAFDFGLVAEKPAAPFHALLSRHDPAWGMRSALQHYYDRFPEFFTRRVKREGGWYVWGNAKDTAGAVAAGYGFHWGPANPEAVKWDHANGLLSLLYIEPELYQQTMGDYPTAPPAKDCVTRLEKIAAGDTAETAKTAKLGYASSYAPASYIKAKSLPAMLQTISLATQRSVFWRRDQQPDLGVGKYPWMTESQWGTIFPCNLDPDIPGGKGWFNRTVFIAGHLADYAAAGAPFDGIALDSFGGYGQHARVNYRREHFKLADAPLSFSARGHQPVQVAAFASLKWLKALAADIHGEGKVLMANCAWNITPGWLTFAAPYLDIFGAEAPRFDDVDFARAIAYRKPCTDLPYNPQAPWEVPWHLLQAIWPGAGHPLPQMTAYDPLLRQLVAAGWEPLTGARVAPPGVRLERYGHGDQVYLVLHNPATQTATATATLDEPILGAKAWHATSEPGARPVTVTGGRFTVPLAARATVMVRLTR